MSTLSKRSTIYFDPAVHKILKLRALEASCSVSDLVNQAVLHELAEDLEDLEAFKARASEPTVSFEEMVKGLRADGKI
jgi:hypothetical protein